MSPGWLIGEHPAAVRCARYSFPRVDGILLIRFARARVRSEDSHGGIVPKGYVGILPSLARRFAPVQALDTPRIDELSLVNRVLQTRY